MSISHRTTTSGGIHCTPPVWPPRNSCRCRSLPHSYREEFLAGVGFLAVVLVMFFLASGQALAQQAPGNWPAAPAPRWERVAAPAPQEMTSPPETLQAAWEAALRADQHIEASRFELSASESSRAAAEAERFPSLKLDSNYYALSDQPAFSVNLAPLPATQLPFFERSSVGFQAMVKQPLYTFGRISSGINAAEEAVKVSEAECGRTRLDVKMRVAEIYVTALRAVRIIQVAESKTAGLEGHARDVANFFDKGLVSKNDLLAAQVALADARQQAMQARNMLRVAHAAYNRALQRNLDEPVRLVELGNARLPGNVDELTCAAMRLRPELEAISAQARAMRQQSASVRAKLSPQVGLTGGFLYQQDKYVDPNGVGVLGVGVEWTPVDSGRIAHEATALSEKAEALIRLRKDAESTIALEVRQKWFDLQTALERVDVARQTTAQADENVRVARDRYQHQVGTNTEVLDAETLRVQAYTNYYNSAYESVLAELRLHRAVGDI